MVVITEAVKSNAASLWWQPPPQGEYQLDSAFRYSVKFSDPCISHHLMILVQKQVRFEPDKRTNERKQYKKEVILREIQLLH